MNGQNQRDTEQGMRSIKFATRKTVVLKKKQRGMTGIAMAFIVVMVGFFALIAVRLFPIYMEHFSVNSHLKQLESESGANKKTNNEILDTLQKRFRVDDVKNVKNENIFIERNGGKITVAIEYEVRTPALGNVEMVVSFVDEIVIN